MQNKKTTSRSIKGSSTAVKLGVAGASIAALATAYFFLGPNGKKHQKQTETWVIKMKADVIKKLNMVHTISNPVYNEIIDTVATEYTKGMKAGNKEINALAQDLKKHWKTISSSARVAKLNLAKGAKRVTKRAGL